MTQEQELLSAQTLGVRKTIEGKGDEDMKYILKIFVCFCVLPLSCLSSEKSIVFKKSDLKSIGIIETITPITYIGEPRYNITYKNGREDYGVKKDSVLIISTTSTSISDDIKDNYMYIEGDITIVNSTTTIKEK